MSREERQTLVVSEVDRVQIERRKLGESNWIEEMVFTVRRARERIAASTFVHSVFCRCYETNSLPLLKRSAVLGVGSLEIEGIGGVADGDPRAEYAGGGGREETREDEGGRGDVTVERRLSQ